MNLPPGIFFINNDITDAIKTIIIQQLHITESVPGSEFDARMIADPNYPQVIHNNNIRLLVIRSDFYDETNRTVADVVMFIKQGMATILKNNFGPPELSIPIFRFDIYKLLRYNESEYVKILPNDHKPIHRLSCGGNFVSNRFKDTSGVHEPNIDNEYNNPDFINRK